MKFSVGTDSERLTLIRRVSRVAPALLFGSCALELAYPALLTHEPPDVDFFVPLDSVIPIVEAIDHVWTSWNETVDVAKLRGRFYVRGRHSTLPTLDLTYESPLDWDAAWARRSVHGSVSVAAARDLATVYRARGRAGDGELARRLDAQKQ